MSKPFTPKQAATKLGCSVDQVRRLMDSGELESVNIGLGEKRRRRVVHPDALQAFLDRRSGPSPQQSSTPQQPSSQTAYTPRW